MSVLRPLLVDPRVRELLATIGVPYAWGSGTPATPWPSDRYDCSGFAQGALVYLGLLRRAEPDRSAAALADACDPVELGHQRLGDLAFYGTGGVHHVMVCLGDGWVIGASGGGSETHGDDPRAHVQLHHYLYRRDWVCFGRIKQEYQP